MIEKLILWLKKWIWLILAFIFVLSLSFIKGCSYGKKHKKCPEIITNTVIVHDTVVHTIVDSFPYYINHHDTVIYNNVVFANVDTAEILKDYFATHISDNRWQDSLVQVDIKTYISENELKHSLFRYRILRPQTIITNIQDNTVTYNSYLYIGGAIPINKFDYSSIDLTLALPKWYLGAGYLPGVNKFAIKGGIKLFKFKK